MHFLKTLFVSAAMATMAIAQTQQLAFTSTPASVTAGKPVTITYAGGDTTVGYIQTILHWKEKCSPLTSIACNNHPEEGQPEQPADHQCPH
jgi:hypothetical protein